MAVNGMNHFRLMLSLCLARTSQVLSGVLDGEGVGVSMEDPKKNPVFNTEEKLKDFIEHTVDAKMQTLERATRESQMGSTFVRWGRKTCTSNSNLVYTGYVGGKDHNNPGSGSNNLCLTNTPQYDDTVRPNGVGYVEGTEYQEIEGHHDQNVPCSVCYVPQAATIMVPGTLTCPAGWTLQYHGHLVSAFFRHSDVDYQCLDMHPEDLSSGSKNEDGNLWYLVASSCAGALPCPPYVSGKIVTCAVCSHI